MKHIIYLLLIFFSFSTHSQTEPGKNQSQLISPKELEMIEIEVTQKLKSNQLDHSKKFLIYMLAGRELYQYRFYDKAKKYYQSALQLDVPDNKSESYINLMAISLVEGNNEELKNEVIQELPKPKPKSESTQKLIDLYDKMDGILYADIKGDMFLVIAIISKEEGQKLSDRILGELKKIDADIKTVIVYDDKYNIQGKSEK